MADNILDQETSLAKDGIWIELVRILFMMNNNYQSPLDAV